MHRNMLNRRRRVCAAVARGAVAALLYAHAHATARHAGGQARAARRRGVGTGGEAAGIGHLGHLATVPRLDWRERGDAVDNPIANRLGSELPAIARRRVRIVTDWGQIRQEGIG